MGRHVGSHALFMYILYVSYQLQKYNVLAAPGTLNDSDDEITLMSMLSGFTNDPLRVFKNRKPSTICAWDHVVCDEKNHVTSLNLSNSRLDGTIYSDIGKLKYLQYLNLENNSLTGYIPASLGNLTNLVELRLGQNPLQGVIPSELGSLRNLQLLNISNTNITGLLPKELGLLRNLSALYLHNNLHVGTILEEFGNLTLLKYLYLHQDYPVSGVGFSGPLPTSFARLQQLTELNLANNLLHGPIPEDLTQIRTLRYLNLSSNHMDGPLPLALFRLPSLSVLKSTLHLSRTFTPEAVENDISNNNFSGDIPNIPSLNFRSINNSLLVKDCSTCHSKVSTKHQRKFNEGILILAIGGSIVLFGVSMVLLWHFRHKFRTSTKGINSPGESNVQYPPIRKASPNKRISLSNRARSQTCKFTLRELKLATNGFSSENVVGQGGFGLVYKATLSTGEVVAVKHGQKDAQQGVDEFYNEVQLLSRIHHKNLVNLVGFCEEQGEQMLVYEYIPNGNLFERLTGVRNPPLTWRQRVYIAIGAAKGLQYLHEGCQPSIIHRDIKPSNILLDENLIAKVADFGLSKTGPAGSATHVSTGVKGTPGYLDPHYYLSWHLGTFSDVYGFGVILLQLIVAKPAVDRTRKYSQYSIVNWAKESIEQDQIEDIMDPYLLKKGYNRSIMVMMARLALRCSSDDIGDRPTMSQICQELEFTLRTLDSDTNAFGKYLTSSIPLDPGKIGDEADRKGWVDNKASADLFSQVHDTADNSAEYSLMYDQRRDSGARISNKMQIDTSIFSEYEEVKIDVSDSHEMIRGIMNGDQSTKFVDTVDRGVDSISFERRIF